MKSLWHCRVERQPPERVYPCIPPVGLRKLKPKTRFMQIYRYNMYIYIYKNKNKKTSKNTQNPKLGINFCFLRWFDFYRHIYPKPTPRAQPHSPTTLWFLVLLDSSPLLALSISVPLFRCSPFLVPGCCCHNGGYEGLAPKNLRKIKKLFFVSFSYGPARNISTRKHVIHKSHLVPHTIAKHGNRILRWGIGIDSVLQSSVNGAFCKGCFPAWKHTSTNMKMYLSVTNI